MNFEQYNSYIKAYQSVIKEANEANEAEEEFEFPEIGKLNLDTEYSLREIFTSKTKWNISKIILNENTYPIDFICNGSELNYNSSIANQYIDILSLTGKVSKNVDDNLCNIVILDKIDMDDKQFVEKIERFMIIMNEHPEKIFNIRKTRSLL